MTKLLVHLPILCVLMLTSMVGLAVPTSSTHAQETKLSVRGSGHPVPRFVTLKFEKANLRAGPGSEYPVLWQYRRMGLPVLVDAEFGVWRKIVDHEGTSGWMKGSLLSLKRKAFVTKGAIKLHAQDNENARVIAVAERGALLDLETCPKQWCRVAHEDIVGWVQRDTIWGIMDGEIIK
ncbi:SH3 domain-containing protein [Alphaproteobacteria bacterium]|jgi:SH3-like domain-containing protein|nr:SH3 domain-containing protein [Alphaproteobacteria bacterium]